VVFYCLLFVPFIITHLLTFSMKDIIRNTLKEKRASLSTDKITELSSKIARTVAKSETFKNANTVAYYHAVKGEANPSLLKSTNKRFFLPVLSKQRDEGLVFIEIDENTQFENNMFDIPEPYYDESKIVKANSLDLVIMPLLAFDKRGNRLGMGGGFYDRSFAFKKEYTGNPILMGYAYSFQEVALLNAEPWDIPLDMIATEESLIIPNE